MTPKEIAEMIGRIMSGVPREAWPSMEHVSILAAAFLKMQETLGDEDLAHAQDVGETNSGFRSGRIILELLQEIRRLRAAAEAYRAEIERLRRSQSALSVLVNRLDEVHADPRYMAVWQLFMIRGGNYTGPQYEIELGAARAAIDAARATDAQGGK